MKFIKYGSIAFNGEWVASKTLTEFKEHEKHHNLSDAQYKEIHDLCKKQFGVKKEATKPAVTKSPVSDKPEESPADE